MKIEFGFADNRPVRDFSVTSNEASVLQAMNIYGVSRRILQVDTALDEMRIAQGLVGLIEKGLAVNICDKTNSPYHLTEEGLLARIGFTPLDKQRLPIVAINPPPKVRLIIEEEKEE